MNEDHPFGLALDCYLDLKGQETAAALLRECEAVGGSQEPLDETLLFLVGKVLETEPFAEMTAGQAAELIIKRLESDRLA